MTTSPVHTMRPYISSARFGALSLIAAFALAASACGDMLFDPAPEPGVSLAVSYGIDPRFAEIADALASMHGSTAAFDKADRVRLRISRSGVILYDTVQAFTPATEVRLQVDLTDAGPLDNLSVYLELRRGTDPIFIGTQELSATDGNTEVNVGLMPVPAAVELADSAALFALGDGPPMQAAALFVTGDTITDPVLDWSTLDPEVLSISPAGVPTAVTNGEARVVAAAGGLVSDTVVFTVRQMAAEVRIASDTIPMHQSAPIAYTILDLNGYELEPGLEPTIGWSTSAATVAAVDSIGKVTGVMLGEALLQATVGPDTWTAPIKVSPLPSASLASGTFHNCALDVEGELYCWGDVQGVDDDLEPTPTPVYLPEPFYMVRSAHATVCGLTAVGSAYCAGSNGMGQAGNGTTGADTDWGPVSGGHEFVDVGVGVQHGCGLTAAGEIYCWGDNRFGQVGPLTGELCGDLDCATTPTLVASGFTGLAVGGWHSCAVDAGGAAQCWGWNGYGQLGDGSTVQSRTPVPVTGGLTFGTLEAGAVTNCGIVADGTTHCWGGNRYGQLGNGMAGGISGTPVQVAGGLAFTSIFPSRENNIYSFFCGLTADGTRYCWGGNDMAKLGVGNVTGETCGSGNNIISCSTTPVSAGDAPRFVGVSGGRAHACGIASDGVIRCWGSKAGGALGDGSLGLRLSPAPVTGGSDYASIAAGKGDHTCALTTAGAAECWGWNGSGQLGTGSTAGSAVPVSVSGGLTFSALTAGNSFNCALDPVGSAYCWGGNNYGQLGDGSTINRPAPVPVTGGVTFQQLTSAYSYTEGIASNERWWWGQGAAGEALVNSTPQNTGGGMTITQAAAGFAHSCVLTASSEVYCRGPNNHGQLGDGTNTDGYMVQVVGGIPFQEITSGGYHTCGLATDGTAHCWGLGRDGQLGHGLMQNSNVPVRVDGGGTRFQSLSAGAYHTCGISTTGAALCWGYNQPGTLGNGTMESVALPSPVSGGGTYLSISAGWEHTCATATDGAYCWGAEGYGQLGDGSHGWVTSPVTVAGMPTLVVSAARLPGAPGWAPGLTRITARSGARKAIHHPGASSTVIGNCIVPERANGCRR